MEFKKSVIEERLVYGEVYAPDRPDVHNEFMSAESIKKMAHNFIKNNNSNSVDLNHDNKLLEGVSVVESFIARPDDPDYIEGAWVVCMHVDNDEIWQAILNGEITGFSLEATGYKDDDFSQVTVEIPPVVSGTTSFNNDHSHKFYVTYDENGKIVGGVTDEVNGHFHRITSPDKTEYVNGHNHLFTQIDDFGIIQK